MKDDWKYGLNRVNRARGVVVLVALLVCGGLGWGAEPSSRAPGGRLKTAQNPPVRPKTIRQRILAQRAARRARPTGMVHFYFTDGARRVPVRVRIVDPAGKTVGALPGLDWLWLDGEYRARLVSGASNVTVTRGMLAQAYRGVLTVKPGEEVHEHFPTPTIHALEATGWRLFDPYIDAGAAPAKAGEYRFSTLGEVTLAARAEGLDAIGLAGEWQLLDPQGIPFAKHVDGAAQLRRARQQSRKADLVRLMSWRGESHIGGEFYAIEPGLVSRAAMAKKLPEQPFFNTFAQIRDRGGLVVYHRPTGRLINIAQGTWVGSAGELLFDVLAGPTFDAIDISRGGDDLELWLRLLSRGYRIPAVGGGPRLPVTVRKNPRGIDLPTVGCYVRPGMKTATAADWLTAIRAGRVVVSNGPLLRLGVDDARIGDTISPTGNVRTITLEAFASADFEDHIRRIDVLYNGKIIHSVDGRGSQRMVQVVMKKRLRQSGWLVARYYSTKRQFWAITNPIYLRGKNSSRPAVLRAQVTVSLRDQQSKKALAGVVEVMNLGMKIQTHLLRGEPVTLDIPVTATLRFRAHALGYAEETRTVYEASGVRELFAEWKKRQRFPAAFFANRATETIRRRLRGVSLTVDLNANVDRPAKP